MIARQGKYVNNGISGATNRCPEFSVMIERVLQGDIQYIIAKDESRLCRSTEVDGYLQTIFRECGVKIIFIVSNNIFDPFNGEQVSNSSILPTVFPIFIYDYKAKNERQEARGKCLFINAEYIQASVITCLRKNVKL